MASAPIRPLLPFIRYMGPTAALQEIIYGLIMALASLSAFAVSLGLDDSTRWTLISAAFGVNLAWGFVDTVMWLFTKNFDRMRRSYMARSIKENPEEMWTVEAVADDLSDSIVGSLDPADQERISLDVLDSIPRAPVAARRVDREVVGGAASCLVLTLLAALPVLVPMMLVDPPQLGLRIASLVDVVLLFLVGYSWAPYAGLSKWRVGLALMLIGSAITLITIALGG